MHFEDILQRINLVAPVHSQRPPSEKEKRHIRAKRSGDFQHLRRHQLLSCQLQVAQHRGYGIARASAETPSRWNSLLQLDFHSAADFQLDRKSTRLNSS